MTAEARDDAGPVLLHRHLRRGAARGRGRRDGRPRHRLRPGAGGPGLERLEAELVGEGFATHRHDTYAVGVTLAGVQSFRYRGEQRHCLPGQWHVLHPDEPHDGAPGTETGFGYRILYLDPAQVGAALDGGPLPFVPDPVLAAGRVPPALAESLACLDEPLDDVRAVEVTTSVADLLTHLAGNRPGRGSRSPRPDLAAVSRVRALLLEEPLRAHRAADLEAVAGVDRWSLARQFRAAYGTSPSRFRALRRLDAARTLVRSGRPLAQVAAETGFSDQAHLTREFRKAYGLPPGAWARAVLAPGQSPPVTSSTLPVT